MNKISLWVYRILYLGMMRDWIIALVAKRMNHRHWKLEAAILGGLSGILLVAIFFLIGLMAQR